MTLTAHALAGAAVATLFPAHPVAGFAAGVASHFLLDAIPHWDYKVRSVRDDRGVDKMYVVIGWDFWKDVAKVVLDCLIGFALAVFLFGGGFTTTAATIAALAGAFGGMFPDGLQFLYYLIFKTGPISVFGRFHEGIQQDRRFQARPVVGITLQILILAAVVVAHFLITNNSG